LKRLILSVVITLLYLIAEIIIYVKTFSFLAVLRETNPNNRCGTLAFIGPIALFIVGIVLFVVQLVILKSRNTKNSEYFSKIRVSVLINLMLLFLPAMLMFI